MLTQQGYTNRNRNQKWTSLVQRILTQAVQTNGIWSEPATGVTNSLSNAFGAKFELAAERSWWGDHRIHKFGVCSVRQTFTLGGYDFECPKQYHEHVHRSLVRHISPRAYAPTETIDHSPQITLPRFQFLKEASRVKDCRVFPDPLIVEDFFFTLANIMEPLGMT